MSADRQVQQDAHFMAIALKQAELAVSRGQTPFGAVVVDSGGQLMGEGHTSVRADLDPTAHGEIVAIRAAWRRLGAWQNLAGASCGNSPGYSKTSTMSAVLITYSPPILTITSNRRSGLGFTASKP